MCIPINNNCWYNIQEEKLNRFILLGCKYTLIYYRFPNDPNLRRRWILATKRKDFIPSKNSSLCSDHFEESDFEIGGLRRQLKPGVIPSLFDFTPHFKPIRPKKRRTIKKFTVINLSVSTLFKLRV